MNNAHRIVLQLSSNGQGEQDGVEPQPMPVADLIGAITANVYFLLIIAVFTARIVGRRELGHWLGLVSILVVIPLIYVLIVGLHTDRSLIYFVWLGLMILFLFIELMVDYIHKLDFRGVRWAVISYVTLFFAATGGMIGLAAQAGKWWGATAFTFLVMATMAFVQRAKTGL